MVSLDTRRLIIPVWVIVVGLVAVFQPPATVGTSVLLLLVLGIVAPAIWLVILSWRQRLLAARRPERRRS
jgi:uncharacterized membrane-anchored protein